MEINPKKMDFEKIKSEGKLRDSMGSKQANNVDGMNSSAKNNSAFSSASPVTSAPAPNSNQPAVSLKKPTELLSEAWKLYKARWKTLLGIVAIPMLIILAVIILGVTLTENLKNAMLSGNLGDSLFNSILSLILLFIFIAVIIAQIWSQVALIYAIKNNGDIGIKESYQKSKSKIKSFFWVSILVGFITMGGFIFFAVPGFIFAVWFAFATFIVITENLKGMDAILKSREYVRGHWWSVLWRFLFMYIVLFGVMIAASIVLMLVPFLGNLVSIALTPLIMVYMFLIYDNLRKIKGNFEFQPSAKARRSFIAVGVLGVLAVPLLFALFVVSLNNARDKAMDTYNESNNIYEEDKSNKKETFEDTIKGRDEQRISDLNSISKMLKRYKDENETYPISFGSTKLNEENYVTNEIESVNENMDIPVDPSDPKYYYSYELIDRNTFELTARLENIDDSGCDFEIKAKSDICIYKLRY